MAAAATAAYAAMMWVTGMKTLCIYQNVFGLPCPGCGITRAVYWFLRGEPGRAFAFHPLFPLILFCIATIIFNNREPFRRLYQRQAFWIGTLVLLVGVWIVRMILLFPSHEPMTFHKEAIAVRLYYFLNNALNIFFS